MRAAADERPIDFDFNERKLLQTREIRPFRAEIVDGNADLAESHLPGEVRHKRQAARDFGAIDLDNDPVEVRVIRKPPTKIVQACGVAQKRHRKID
jgi:hypothetical protein